MNYRKLIVIVCSAICYHAGIFALFGERTFFSTRSQSVNAALELVGWEKEINQPGQNTCYGTVAGAVDYTHSFHTDAIAKFLFGSECLFFSGSKAMNRGPNDILADYFGLPFCYKSCVSFDPVISNVIFDLNWYQSIGCGSYVRLHVPLVHSKWDLNLQEVVLDNGDNFSMCGTFTFYPAGYMGPDRIERAGMHTNVREAFEGKTRVGDLQPLQFGKIFGRQLESRIAEIQIALGWNYFLSDWYHLGLEIRTAIPTGNRPDAEFLFEAIVGNSHHWELGAGLTSHVDVWRSCNECHTLALYMDANVTHLFSDTQNRSYDLKNGPGSRYMLAQLFGTGSTDLRVGASDGPPAEHQYIGCIVPVVNITTLPTDISIAVQGDIVLKCAYQRADGFECDIGYNFWGRSKEESNCRRSLERDHFVLKGDAQVYGFDPDEERVPLSVSQSQATLHKAQAQTNFVPGVEFRNENADFPVLAFDANGDPLTQVTLQDAIDLDIDQGQINTSNPTVFLSDDDIDSCSPLLPRALTHKFFFHIGHAWHCAEKLKPYIGIGGAAEWAHTNARHNSGYSQASIWVKGGFSY